MTSRAEFERAVEGESSKPGKILVIAALLWRDTGNEVVIVAGSAIEVQTEGRTVSEDIDLVTPRPPAEKALRRWGFLPAGRLWRRADWAIDVDLLGTRLVASRLKLRRVETPYGPALVAGAEDLIAYRLAELKYWQGPKRWRDEIVRHVTILLSEYGDQLDEEYLAFVARRDGIEDVLGDFRNHFGSAAPADLRRV